MFRWILEVTGWDISKLTDIARDLLRERKFVFERKVDGYQMPQNK